MSYVTSSINCNCHRKAVIRTSWTNDNPGRRFYSCINYQNGGCDFFDWYDNPICHRARMIIPGLLRRKNELQLQNEKLEKENIRLRTSNQNLKKIFVLLLPLVILIWFCTAGKSKGDEHGYGNVKMLG